MKEPITEKAYQDLAVSRFPNKPSGFNGSQTEWETAWSTGKAKAIGGRYIDGETQLGDAIVHDDAMVQIFLGDLDNEGSLKIPWQDYTGEPGKLTTISLIPIPGVTIVNGIIKGL
ncbi:MAG: hypothetical protein HOO67_06205 [Candidatus Peribacteraceae bacterium]|nr:hypothetical protein [Candidatus Peribacteraceae bacterium]